MTKYEPVYKLRWVLTLPRTDPPVSDRTCMPGLSFSRRLARQIRPRTELRACCWHHSVDWHIATAAAISIVRKLRRERFTDEEDRDDRFFDLLESVGLSDREEDAVLILASLEAVMTLDVRVNTRRKFYQDGRKRSHAMLEAGVHRTVTVWWREIKPWHRFIRPFGR